MKRCCAGSFGLGAILLGSAPSLAQDRISQSTSAATLVVRVDDRKAHDLNQPWVSLIYADGTMLDALALDDGTDVEDAFGGDHLYVARMNVPPGEDVEVWILDSGPVDSGMLIRESRVDLTAGRTQRITMRSSGASPGSASRVTQEDAAPLSGTAIPTGQEPPSPGISQDQPQEPGIDPSLGFAREATITPVIPNFRRWKSRDVWGLVGLFLLGWTGLRILRRTRRSLIRQIDETTGILNDIACSPHSRAKPQRSATTD